LWGRPGGGAPIATNASFKKTKLDKALHYPDPKNIVSRQLSHADD